MLMKRIGKSVIILGLAGLVGCDSNPTGPSVPVAPAGSGTEPVVTKETGKSKKVDRSEAEPASSLK